MVVISSDQICSWCRNIDIEHATSAQGHQLHSSLAALRKCAQQCHLCSKAYETARNDWPKDYKIRGDAADRKVKGSWYKESDVNQEQYLIFACFRLHKYKQIVQGASLDLKIRRRYTGVMKTRAQVSSSQKELSKNRPWVFVWKLEVEGAECLDDDYSSTTIPILRSLPATTASDSTFSVARRWLDNCVNGRCGHRSDRTARAQLTFSNRRPARLLEINDAATLQLRLLDGNTTQNAYAALSYCWGSGHAWWKTTSCNLKARYQQFGIHELPKTLADAVSITFRLGLHNLWVDSICIVQDSQEDWNAEARKMADIYRNAKFTIAADSSTDCEAGIFNKQSKAHADDMPGVVRIAIQDGESELLLSTAEVSSQWDQCVSKSPLSTRGWCCQENVLSPRILHYTQTQLFWECYHCHRSEDNYVTSRSMPPINDARYRLKMPMLIRQLQNSNVAKFEAESLLYTWYCNIISRDYSARQLTFPEDKLIAVAGIAQAIEELQPMQYCAGLWQYDLIKGMCWSGSGRRAPMSRAPSWSWASQDGSVFWLPALWRSSLFSSDRHKATRYSEYAKVTEVTTDATTGEDGEAESCAGLTLMAHAVAGKTIPSRNSESQSDVEVLTEAMFPFEADLDDNESLYHNVHVCLMVEIHAELMSQTFSELFFLLLSPSDNGGETFIRIGLGWVRHITVQSAKEIVSKFACEELKTFRIV